MKTINEFKSEKITIAEFASLLFSARKQIHIKHLQTNSYSEHKALNEFYEKILDLTDDFIETYQGQYGIIKTYKIKDVEATDVVSYLQKFIETTKNYSKSLEDSHLQNILDEMIALSYKTVYKLKNLK